MYSVVMTDGGIWSRVPVFIRECLYLLLGVLLTVLVYSNTQQVPFTFDDLPNIEENPHIRLTELSLSGLWEAGFSSHLPRRPVANISFALNYYVGGYEVAGYHWVNLVIHTLAGVGLYYFLRLTLLLFPGRLTGYFRVPGVWLVFLVVGLWLVHPLQVQSVTYIVQRMNAMASLFFVGSL